MNISNNTERLYQIYEDFPNPLVSTDLTTMEMLSMIDENLMPAEFDTKSQQFPNYKPEMDYETVRNKTEIVASRNGLNSAILHHNLNMTKYFIKKSPEYLNSKSTFAHSPLLFAIQCRQWS